MIAPWILIAAAAVAALSLAVALWRAQWRALRARPERMHLVAGGALCCLLLWLLNIHLVDGLLMHFLGMSTLTLLVGWSFAVLAASFAVATLYLLQGLDAAGFGLSLFLTVLLPATLTRTLARVLHRPGLRHPFVYILGVGFAGAGLVVLLLAVLALGVFWLSGLDSYLANALEWWPLLFLLMFSEAFINGMCVSALAIFYPDWMKTFDDRFYLDDH